MPDEETNKGKSQRKKRTRGNRDAKPYRRSHDGKWVAVAYLPDGRRKPCYGVTAREAAAKRKKLYQEIENQEPITVGRELKLERYLRDIWFAVTLPQRVAAGRMSSTTLDSYRDNAEKHIIPYLGRYDILNELGTGHLRKWLLELQAKPSGRRRTKLRPGETELPPPELLGSRTIAYCHAILRKALSDAVKDEIIKPGRNVAKLVDPPLVERQEILPPTQEQAAELLAAASEDRLWAYWLILLTLGLRRGEGLGLRWEHVNLDEGTVRLEKSVQRVRGETDEETGRRRGKLVEKRLKTKASKATLALPAAVVAAFRQHRQGQLAERALAKVWIDDGLVFTTSIGTRLEPRNVNRAWTRVCERAGVGQFRIHDLRHAAATYLYESGVDRRVIQKTLRHTRAATTDDIYTHVFEETQRVAADSMDGILDDLAKRTRKRAG